MDDTIQHHGVKGMKWGVRKDKKKYTYRQDIKPKNNRIMKSPTVRRIVGSKFTKNAILKNRKLNDDQKKLALLEWYAFNDEARYNKANRVASRRNGTVTYDVASGQYYVKSPKKVVNAITKQTLYRYTKVK